MRCHITRVYYIIDKDSTYNFIILRLISKIKKVKTRVSKFISLFLA